MVIDFNIFVFGNVGVIYFAKYFLKEKKTTLKIQNNPNILLGMK
jgi:hypothetical protein